MGDIPPSIGLLGVPQSECWREDITSCYRIRPWLLPRQYKSKLGDIGLMMYLKFVGIRKKLHVQVPFPLMIRHIVKKEG